VTSAGILPDLLVFESCLGSNSVQVISDPHPEGIEREGLQAGADFAFKKVAQYALQIPARRATRHSAYLGRGRENMPLGELHNML
jgi:hypothetical protein